MQQARRGCSARPWFEQLCGIGVSLSQGITVCSGFACLVNRRQFLALSLAVPTVGVAGCSSLQSESSGHVLHVLELENHTSHEAVFEVAILDADEETVYGTEQPVAGGSAVSLPHPTDEPGHYTIQLTTDGQALTQTASSFAETGDSCVIAVGRLGQAERLRIDGHGYDDCLN